MLALKLALTARVHAATVKPKLAEVAAMVLATEASRRLVPRTIKSTYPREVQIQIGALLRRLQVMAERKGILSKFDQAWLWVDQAHIDVDASSLDKQEFRLYEMINDLIDLVTNQHHTKDERASAFEIPTQPISPIFTRHPCLMKHAEAIRILGQINDHLAGRSKDTSIEYLIETLWQLPYEIPKFTLKSEIETNADYIATLMWAAGVLEVQHGLEPGSLMKPYSWTGYEADRNANTSGVVGLTPIVVIQRMIIFYRQKIEEILKSTCSETTKEALLEFKKTLNLLEEQCKVTWRLGKTLPTIDVMRTPSKYKFISDNMEQLFPPKSSTVKEFWETSKTRYKLPEDLESARSEVERLLAEAYQQLFKLGKQLETNLNGLAEKLTDPEERRRVEELEHCVKDAGIHPAKGQGRLDSKEVVKHAAEQLLKQEKHLKELHFTDETELLIAALKNPSTATREELEALDPEAREAYNQFRIIRTLNSAGEIVPIMVLANFSSKEDFLRALYIAAKAGLVEIKDGKVISSKLLIVPLLESVDDHYDAGKIFEDLFSLPIVQSYYQTTGEVCVMSAYSDTPRQDGLPGARFAIPYAAQCIHEVFQKYFKGTGIKLVRQHGNGSHPGRSGGEGVDSTWPMMDFDYIGHRRTWQPGILDTRARTPTDALHTIKAALKRPEFIKPFSKEFITTMIDFIQPGMDYYRELTKPVDGELNKFLLGLPETGEVLNHRALGSRTKKWRNLHELTVSIIWGERMITVTQLLDLLGLDLTTIVSFAVSIQHVDAEQLAQYQNDYKTDIYFRAWINKKEEQIFSSFPDTWQYYRHHNPPLVDKIIALHKQAELDILKITGQTALLENRPQLQTLLGAAKARRRTASAANTELFAIHSPKPPTSSLTAATLTTKVAGAATHAAKFALAQAQAAGHARIATARAASTAFMHTRAGPPTSAPEPLR